MKLAKELFAISQEQAPILVKSVLDGVKENCIARCEEEANKGSTYYSIYLKQTLGFVKELLLEKCIELIKEFEDNGYKVSIDDLGNGYYTGFVITFSWNGYIKEQFSSPYKQDHLYDTDKGTALFCNNRGSA